MTGSRRSKNHQEVFFAKNHQEVSLLESHQEVLLPKSHQEVSLPEGTPGNRKVSSVVMREADVIWGVKRKESYHKEILSEIEK